MASIILESVHRKKKSNPKILNLSHFPLLPRKIKTEWRLYKAQPLGLDEGGSVGGEYSEKHCKKCVFPAHMKGWVRCPKGI